MKLLLTALLLALGSTACDTTNSSASKIAPPPMDGAIVYEITFTPMWTAQSHPLEYPQSGLFSGPHFSGLIGASHGAGYALLEVGAAPTPGLERLSEEGKHAPLDAEIRAAIADGKAGQLFEMDAVKDLAQSVTTTVAVSERFPMVSAVAMIAPSPDWFAGAADVELRDSGRWVSVKEVTLFAYDSGGDAGTTYTAADADTNPKAPTSLNAAPHFVQNGERVAVGKLTFRRL